MLQLPLLLALQSGYSADDLPVLARYEFETEVGDSLGASLALVGDWDGDGVEDYAVGSPGADLQAVFVELPDHGRVEVRSGVDDSVIAASVAFLLPFFRATFLTRN